MKSKTKKDFEDYVPMQEAPRTQQVAHFLDWAARKYPKRYFPHTEVTRATKGYAHTPRESDKEVEAVRSVMCGVKKVLLQQYGRGFHSVRNVGVRACVDAEDATRFDLKGKVEKRVSLDRSIQLVSEKAIETGRFSTTPEGKQLAAFHKGVMQAVDFKGLDRQLKGLLPAAPKP